MSDLALFGGKPVRTQAFPPHPVIGEAEKRAVMAVLDSGKLSGFIAAPGDAFLGGAKVREFEERFAAYHGVRFAVAFNSATSALHAAVVAVGVEPGEEVIVTPYSFTASASCVLMHNAVPVFADVEDRTFGLDPEAVARAITPRTRAILPVHLFGHPVRMDGLLAIAHEHGLKIIEDCAQSPGAMHHEHRVGTIGDCGVFSFTENKNIATGEGGMLITDDEEIAQTARLVRNHGEAVWGSMADAPATNSILGWNYRMTEIEAAIGMVQFERMDDLNAVRAELAHYLTNALSDIDGLTPPVIEDGCTHSFYLYAMRYNEAVLGIPRQEFVRALNAEGVPFGAGYVPPLYRGPIYHQKQPVCLRSARQAPDYGDGTSPVCERLHEQELIVTPTARHPATVADMDDVVRAIRKVLAHREAFLQTT